MSDMIVNIVLGIALAGILVSIIGFVLTYQPDKRVFVLICMAIEITVVGVLAGADIVHFTQPASALGPQPITQHVGPTATPAPSASPTSAPTYYYRADWLQGAGDWSLAPGWSWSGTDGGMLVANGRENDSWIFPAAHIQNPDYTLQVKIRRLSYTNVGGPSFGVVVRYTNNTGGYVCGVGKAILPEHYFLALGTAHNGSPMIVRDLARQPMTVDQQWHVYRLDVQGNHMTLSVDGSFIASVTDSTYANPGQVGLYASAAVIDVEDFVVLPLAGRAQGLTSHTI